MYKQQNYSAIDLLYNHNVLQWTNKVMCVNRCFNNGHETSQCNIFTNLMFQISTFYDQISE